MKGYLFGLGAMLVGGDRQGGSRARRRQENVNTVPNSI